MLAASGFVTIALFLVAVLSRRVSVLIALTESGRDAVDAAHERANAWRRRIFDALEPEERERAAALLTRLSQVMEEQTP